jgi:hypothetical protein
MYGAYIRGGITAVGVTVVGALLNFILPYITPYLGPKNELIYQSFDALGNNMILLGLVAVGAGILAAAVTESNSRGI